jgi:beta-lactamase superfamily II metal-dependent hydrolase
MPIARRKPNRANASPNKLLPPQNGVTVRMYRIGHGDCFLLAFPGKSSQEPVYVLIDCGYKPGSPKFIKTTAKEVTSHIREATGGHIDVAVITHEHQDHVNGITEANFAGFTIDEAWFAWTEKQGDELADELRRKFKDRLLALMEARNRLAADSGSADKVKRIDDFLAFELGGDDEHDFSAAAADVLLKAANGAENSQNKRAMKLFKTLAEGRVQYLRPHVNSLKIAGADRLRVFPLGPPRDPELLHSLDPEGEEEFRTGAFAASSSASYFAAALGRLGAPGTPESPFPKRYRAPWEEALAAGKTNDFWLNFYGQTDLKTGHPVWLKRGENETESNPQWRRIDQDWLYSAEQLALDMNNDTNNGSLVLAFELSPGGKVLLFAADAQRGNWISWTKGVWKDGDREVTTRDLLARTVLYKAGHHGSHNATLNGKITDDYANLDWMGTGDHAGEFTAMITAVRPWAETQKGWDHPLKAIKDALLQKTAGRVFQTDTDVENLRPLGAKTDWDAFQTRIKGDRLFIDYTIIS